MAGVLVDACGWIAVVDSRINIDLQLESMIGPVELKITASVLEELKRIDAMESKTLLLDLLISRAEIVSGNGNHTDDELIDLAKNTGWPVLTVDRGLKARLHDANASVIEVTGSNTLRLLE
ncbi:MAG: hypothetical protein VYC11_02570 [Candidatus Thermoplasmatota archaeon]|nr:hypothetical protein [Candidatus Thermoplasmatota archaeon]